MKQFSINGLQVGIDERTGNLTRLNYFPTGMVLKSSSESSGFLDLAYPVESFFPLRLASRFSEASIIEEKNKVTIFWDRLGPSRSNFVLPTGKVSAYVTIRAADDGRSVIFSCRIENRSEMPIPQILFPDLHGLMPFDGIEKTQLRFAGGVVQPFTMPLRPPDTAHFYGLTSAGDAIGWNHYPMDYYYGTNSMRWIDYGSLIGGISIFQKKWGTDDRQDIRTQRTESDPMSLRLLWEHKEKIKPGETWESGEFWLTPHPGGWAKGIEVYRDYVKKVQPPRELPKHVRDGIGFQTIWMRQSVETDPAKAAFRFADLPRVAKDAKEHGIDELVLWSWSNSFELPIREYQELGTREELVKNIKKAREMGVNVSLFVSIQIILDRYLDRYGVEPGKDKWTYHPDFIPVFNPFYSMGANNGSKISPENELWQQDVLAALKEWIDLGVASISWDVFGSERGNQQEPAIIRLTEKIRALARAKDPESTFSGESATPLSFERDGAVLDYTWNWSYYSEAGPILNVLRSPRLNCNIDDSPLVVKKAFCDGLYINAIPKKPDQPNGTALISEVPEISMALKEIVPLRKKFLSFFVEGTFIGDSMLSEDATAFVRGYQLNEKLLFIVLNDKSRPQYVTIQSDLDLWLSSTRHYQVKSYDSGGELVETTWGEGPHWLGITHLLQPLKLAFFEIQSNLEKD